MPEPTGRPARILPVIVFSQFAGTSLWFAGNAIIPDLGQSWQIGANAVGNITSAVQFGFIIGTLLAAFLSLSDRYSPRNIFLCASLLGACCNLLLLVCPRTFFMLLFLRLLTGVALAGIYPVGMKIAAGWYRYGLGNALGFLVGALVLGTAFPHLLRSMDLAFHWEEVLRAVSALAAGGGILMALLVPDGPFHPPPSGFSGSSIQKIFSVKELRVAALGYFGHMWELYTFYAFVPLMLTFYGASHPGSGLNIPFWSFCIIAAGSAGCVFGGFFSNSLGSARVAGAQLTMSGFLCLCSPFLFFLPWYFFMAAMMFWGMVVVGDSPQFSALVAQYAPAGLVGSALTMTNSIGFAITIVSVQCTGFLAPHLPENFLLAPLFVGPLLGLVALARLRRRD